MILADIDSFTDTRVQLKPFHWIAADLLGKARTATNDGVRNSRADRGRFNNSVDLLGSLGELFLLSQAIRIGNAPEAVGYVRSHIFNEGGGSGVVGPDFRFQDEQTAKLHEIDVKTFDCDPRKHYFAINDNKHKNLKGQCTSYVCVLAAPWGRHMAVAKLVPYSAVDAWTVDTLRKGGTPSRNEPIHDFLKKNFTTPPKLEELWGSTFSQTDLRQPGIIQQAREYLAQLIPRFAERLS